MIDGCRTEYIDLRGASRGADIGGGFRTWRGKVFDMSMPTNRLVYAAQQFPMLSGKARGGLVRGGLRTARAVQAASDVRVLQCPGFGKGLLAEVREKLPHIPAQLELATLPPPNKLVPCKHCSGTGWMPEGVA